MYAVGRLGSYISRGVYTVSGPFHPFGGAVDIIVVQQKDGSLKSSPWYVRFGKFQGVLKAKEKLVKINVNGVDSDCYMHLDHKGEAYFMREVDSDELDSVSSPYISSSGDDTDGQSPDLRRPTKSKGCSSDSVTQVDASNMKILSRNNSRRSRILGFVLGRRSMKGERPPRPLEDECLSTVTRTDSWDRAEIAADLLEVRWSTNLAVTKHRKDDTSRLSVSVIGKVDDQDGIEMSSLSYESIQNGEELVDDGIDQNQLISCSYEEVNVHSLLVKEPSEKISSSVSDESEDSEEEEVKKHTESSEDDNKRKIHNTKVGSSRIDIPGNDKPVLGERKMAESLPNIQSHVNIHKNNLVLSRSLDSNSGLPIWKEFKEDVLDNMEADNGKGLTENSEFPDENKSNGLNSEGDSIKPVESTSGNWRGWPFQFKRVTTNGKTCNESDQSLSEDSNTEKSMEASCNIDGDEDSSKSVNEEKMEKMNKKKKKKLRELTPTSEQLVSLNLKEGSNTVTFTFSTSMLGPQQVQARIYLWKWDTRIVISDVDGTITKSDVLGQFMPLVGIDWSQTGVTHLFSSIKENGYELLFLSARAISQAHVTKQFLLNLKQDGKALPEGPVIISPDGLFPSLFREVIRRAPHEFKIACLEDIKALFPSDHNPFYAGFGNRDTDKISYLKVGIPIGKIFIINTKGEVVVNRQVDTKSYTSIHVLVHDMFPPSSSPEQEDFNSWNFWKLPAPVY